MRLVQIGELFVIIFCKNFANEYAVLTEETMIIKKTFTLCILRRP